MFENYEKTYIITTIFLQILWSLSSGISIKINSEPKELRGEGGTSSEITTFNPLNTTITSTTPLNERQKRLLPPSNYNNFDFVTQQPHRNRIVGHDILYFVPKNRNSPFTIENALPGSFTPMRTNNHQYRRPSYTPQPTPEFNTIYNKLWELKSKGYENFNPQNLVKTFIRTYTPKNIEINGYNTKLVLEINRDRKRPTKRPFHPPSTIVHENYIAQKYPKYEYYPVATPSPPPTTPSPPQHHLGDILKGLQGSSNTLPDSFTVDNIDNSIKTLTKILNFLRKQKIKQEHPQIQPIVVQDEEDDEYENHPSDTPEGGTPGIPGVDYPALSTIPQTNFNCKTQRYKGFFGDPDTNCQVWHYCDLNGGKASFLCPNGTIFSQVALTCDWWFNVKCSSTPQLYVLNERLYKYILPFAPKFPEDYTGPLVDKYLALKFMEMEERMKKEKKGKNEDETTTLIENDTTEIPTLAPI